MDVPAPLSASALERVIYKVNLRANGNSGRLLVIISLGAIFACFLLCRVGFQLLTWPSLGHPAVCLGDLTLSFLVFIEIFLSIDFLDPSLWSDLKQSCHQEWHRPNCHAGGAFVPGQSAAVHARHGAIFVHLRFAEVGQSIHAPGNLSGKGSNHNGKEVGIVEEPLENVEVFGGNLSAIDFIEEHEEDEGDEDILFVLFPADVYCCI